MSPKLEDRLEHAANNLPVPSAESRVRAQNAALAVLSGRPSNRPHRVLLLVPAIALAVAVVGLLAPWRDSPLSTGRALAALGSKPVLHAVVEQSSPREIVIDLASGRERIEAHRSEFWHDNERDTLRVRLSVGGTPLPGGEYVHSPDGFFADQGVLKGQARTPHVDPALEGFASGYREALDNGDATEVGKEVVDGEEAVILRYSLPPGPANEQFVEEVAVAEDDYRPLRFRFSSEGAPGTRAPWSEAARVIQIETVARDPGDFEPPQASEPRLVRQTGITERPLEPGEARAALGRPALWPGRTVKGVELAEIELVRLTNHWTDGRVTEGRVLVFRYGADQRNALTDGKPSLTITEGTSARETPRFELGGPAPQRGELRLSGAGDGAEGDAEMWFAAMQSDGVYTSFQSRQRDLILAAANAMGPLDSQSTG